MINESLIWFNIEEYFKLIRNYDANDKFYVFILPNVKNGYD